MPKVKPVDNHKIKNEKRTNQRRRRQRNKRIGTQKKYDIMKLNDNVQYPAVTKATVPASSWLVPLSANSGHLGSKQSAVFKAGSNASPTLTNTPTHQGPIDKTSTATSETEPSKVYSKAELQKYKKKKYCLFSRLDEGILLDDESWFSVTPEKVAREIAERCRFDCVLDAFCGAGGNTIQFAITCKKRVVAIDIDPKKIELAKNNARVYGVQDRIVFIVADFFQLAEHLTSMDMVFLSPPWGGPDYQEEPIYDIENLLPRPATELMKVARTISSKICLYLPRKCNREQVRALALDSDTLEIKRMFGGVTGRSLIAVTAFFNC